MTYVTTAVVVVNEASLVVTLTTDKKAHPRLNNARTLALAAAVELVSLERQPGARWAVDAQALDGRVRVETLHGTEAERVAALAVVHEALASVNVALATPPPPKARRLTRG